MVKERHYSIWDYSRIKYNEKHLVRDKNPLLQQSKMSHSIKTSTETLTAHTHPVCIYKAVYILIYI